MCLVSSSTIGDVILTATVCVSDHAPARGIVYPAPMSSLLPLCMCLRMGLIVRLQLWMSSFLPLRVGLIVGVHLGVHSGVYPACNWTLQLGLHLGYLGLHPVVVVVVSLRVYLAFARESESTPNLHLDLGLNLEPLRLGPHLRMPSLSASARRRASAPDRWLRCA